MNIPTFQEWLNLNEAPEGWYGDWDGGNEMGLIGHVLSDSLINKLITLYSDDRFTFYIRKDYSSCYVVNNKVIDNTPTNSVVLLLKLSNFEITMADVTALQTNMVKSMEKFKDSKLAKTLYSNLIQYHGVLVCDYDQYDGARALWKSLGKITEYHKYVYDEVEDSLTKLNNFSDDNLWSFNNSSKRYKLLVLSKKEIDTNPKY